MFALLEFYRNIVSWPAWTSRKNKGFWHQEVCNDQPHLLPFQSKRSLISDLGKMVLWDMSSSSSLMAGFPNSHYFLPQQPVSWFISRLCSELRQLGLSNVGHRNHSLIFLLPFVLPASPHATFLFMLLAEPRRAHGVSHSHRWIPGLSFASCIFYIGPLIHCESAVLASWRGLCRNGRTPPPQGFCHHPCPSLEHSPDIFIICFLWVYPSLTSSPLLFLITQLKSAMTMPAFSIHCIYFIFSVAFITA